MLKSCRCDIVSIFSRFENFAVKIKLLNFKGAFIPMSMVFMPLDVSFMRALTPFVCGHFKVKKDEW